MSDKKRRRLVKELRVTVEFLDEKVAELERRVEELEKPNTSLYSYPNTSPGTFRSWPKTPPTEYVVWNSSRGNLDGPPFNLVPPK